MSSDSKSPKDWWEVFKTQNPVPQKSLDHFANVAWTSNYLRNPLYQSVPVFSRTVKPDGEDFFFSNTVNTDDTILHYVCLIRKDFGATVPNNDLSTQGSAPGRKAAATPPEYPDCNYLLSIGKNGLDGHPGTLHGGMACAILDETMGNMIMMHIHNVEGPVRQSHAYTAYLHITYRAPAPTSSDLLVRTWLVKRDGRKWTGLGQIVDKHGTVCTEAESLFITLPQQKL